MERPDRPGLLGFFQANYRDILRFLLRRTGDPNLSAEAVQNVYARLAQAPERPEDVSEPRAYLHRAVSNAALDLRRSARRTAITHVSIEEAELLPDFAPAPDRVLAGKQRLAQLNQALTELAPRPRQALLMSRVEGLSHAEIASRLGVSESMIAKYLAQSLRHCRDRLDEGDGP